MPALSPCDRGLRVLSLDGGGVRGLSALYILDRLMYRLKPEADPKKRVKPCEVFDIIVGTSTGGLIAIMLGRLEMDVDSCIKAYRELAKDIFTPRRRTYLGSTMVHRLLGSSSFSARKLESGIKRIIRENVQCIHTASEGESNTLDQSAALSDTGGPVTFPSGVANKDKYTLEETPMVAQLDQKCKVFVCCTLDTGRSYRIRSYQSRHDPGLPFAIWQAARATSAAPTFFDPLKMKNIATLHDGGLRNNNPINEVIDEIRTEFDGREISCLVSIGTGVCKTELFKKNLISVAKACARIATDTEQTERIFRSTHASPGQSLNDRYFRFEVEQGLQDIGMEEWRHMKRVWGVTTSYLDDPARRQTLGKCATMLESFKLEAVPESEPAIEEPRFSEAAIYHHEFLGLHSIGDFVGRDTDMDWLEQELSPKKSTLDQSCKRKSTVVTLTGLGGSGKTQLMLLYAETYRDFYSAIFWIDCESERSIQESFNLIARLLNIGSATRVNYGESQESSALVRKVDVDDICSLRRWIEGRRHPWLLLFDNMANQSLTSFVTRTLPVANTVNGHVIVTSRARLSPSGWLSKEIGALDPASAQNLLFRHARISDPTPMQIDQAALITQELGYFPLSVSLAGTYIQVVETMDRYLIHYEERKRALLKKALGRSLPDGYPGSVFITWQTSLSLLPEPAIRFFRLLCALDRTNVSIDLLRRASSPKQRWSPDGDLVTITPSENGVPDWFLKMCLSDSGEWDELNILDHVFQLESLFFLRRETVEGSWLYESRVAKQFKNGNSTSIMRIERFVQEIGRLMLEDTELQEYAAAAICIAIHSIEDDVPKSFRLRESSTEMKDNFVVLLPTGGMSCNVHTLTLTLEECYRHIHSASECYPRLPQYFRDNDFQLFNISHDSIPVACWFILSGIHLGDRKPGEACQDEATLGSAFAFAALGLENEHTRHVHRDNTIASWSWLGRVCRLLEWQVWSRMCWQDGTKLSIERESKGKLTIKHAGPASFTVNFNILLACVVEAHISIGLTSNPFSTGDKPFQGNLSRQTYVDLYANALRGLVSYKLFPGSFGVFNIDNDWIIRKCSVDFRSDISLTEPLSLFLSDKQKYRMPIPPRSADSLISEFQQSAIYKHVRVGMAIVAGYWIRVPATELLALPTDSYYVAK